MRKESETSIARKYIEENMHRMKRSDMIKHLYATSNLGNSTIQNLCTEILNKAIPIKEIVITPEVKDTTLYYKGRKRQFFKIDDSKLYV